MFNLHGNEGFDGRPGCPPSLVELTAEGAKGPDLAQASAPEATATPTAGPHGAWPRAPRRKHRRLSSCRRPGLRQPASLEIHHRLIGLGVETDLLEAEGPLVHNAEMRALRLEP